MKKKTKMKTKNIIQRLCLFLFALVLALPAAATDYGNYGYEIFRSRKTVNAVGKKKPVRTLRQGKVEIYFSKCNTTGGTGSDAIYELAKGSRITVKADEGYAVRWIILRDTEGGERYSHPDGIKRISSVTSDYEYYFEWDAISRSRISEGNKDDLNDDDNNIVVYRYAATSQTVIINTHNNKNWGQFKVRDIIVGYVRAPKVKFGKERYDVYYTSIPNFKPDCDFGGHDGDVWYKVDNTNIATVNDGGKVNFWRPGTVVLTATCDASKNCAKAQCSTTVNMMRDRVTFTAEGLPDVIFSNDSYNLREYLNKRNTQSGRDFDQFNSGFSVTSSNPDILRYDGRRLKFGGTSGEATITLRQEQNNYYEATTFSHSFIVMRCEGNTVLIKDANEWKLFCKLVNDKGLTRLNARLEADIDLGNNSMMVGTKNHKYAGTFDGNGHTLTVHVVGAGQGTAPFHRTDDATIKNLTIAGTVTAPANTDNYHTAGLVGFAESTTLRNCIVKADIHLGRTGDQYSGGLIGHILSGNTTIKDCAFIGSITGDNGNVSTISGLIAWGDAGTTTISNSYVNATYTKVSGLNPILRRQKGTTNNLSYVYYSEKSKGINPDHNKNGNLGEQVTADQLKSGEVAYKLQNGRSENVWGQNLDTDNEPLLTADAAKRVRKVDFTYKNDVKATRYANDGKSIHGGMPTFTAKDLLGTGYNEHHFYTITLAGGFNGSTTVNADRKVAINLVEKDCYEIASKENWKEFCDLVKGGQIKLNAKMTANVDLGSDITMAGTNAHKYSGTFDGQGYTLKLNWDSGSNGYIAPFCVVEGATIKNLRTEGQITSNEKFLSGLLMSAYGTTTLTNCVSNVNITSSILISACDAAGLICFVKPGANVTIDDCVVKGNITATTDKGKNEMAGFVRDLGGTCTLNNCLYLGSGNGDTFSRTFVGDAYYGVTTTLNNCYYLNTCGKAQGTKITAEQLKSGEVTKKLQADRTDKCYWAQQLGEMPDFYNAADKSKANYVYYDAAKKGWTCDDFRLTDGQPLPIGLDFTAATVTYERNFNGAQKATLCLPYDLSAQGFKAYTLSGGNKNEVHFKEVDDKLTAYTPYYITANGMPQLGGRNIEVKAYKADKMTTPAAGYKFTGTVAGVSNATAAAANAYILQDDGLFHKVTTEHPGATVPAYRAYVTCPKGAGAKQLSIVIDGETTGIGGATNDARGRADGPVYDLQGRRVADRLDDAARYRLPAGVYIVGGRKVVVK